MEIHRITREVNVVIWLKPKLLGRVCGGNIKTQHAILVVTLHRRDKSLGRYSNFWRPLHRYSFATDHTACQTAILLLQIWVGDTCAQQYRTIEICVVVFASWNHLVAELGLQSNRNLVTLLPFSADKDVAILFLCRYLLAVYLDSNLLAPPRVTQGDGSLL